MIESLFNSPKIKFHMPVLLKWLITMVALLVGWVLFRSPDLKYAGEYLGIMFGVVKSVNTENTLAWYLNSKIAIVLVLAMIASVPWKTVFPSVVKRFEGTLAGVIFQDVSFVILLIVSIVLVVSSSYNSFIYFKF